MLQKFKGQATTKIQGARGYMLSKLQDVKGQGMVEYALIIGLVAIVVIGVLVLLGPAISEQFQAIIDAL